MLCSLYLHHYHCGEDCPLLPEKGGQLVSESCLLLPFLSSQNSFTPSALGWSLLFRRHWCSMHYHIYTEHLSLTLKPAHTQHLLLHVLQNQSSQN
jgi:hypothetical protein